MDVLPLGSCRLPHSAFAVAVRIVPSSITPRAAVTVFKVAFIASSWSRMSCLPPGFEEVLIRPGTRSYTLRQERNGARFNSSLTLLQQDYLAQKGGVTGRLPRD